MAKDNTLYNRLEISSDASETDIKKAYNRLSKIYHPDKVHDESEKEKANIKFSEINQAKEVLLDSEKRSMYDQLGMEMFSSEGQAQQHNPFEHMFNGGGFQFGNMHQPQERQQDVVKVVDVTLEQIYNEEVINFTFKQKVCCNTCNGEGTKDGKTSTCSICNGQGKCVQVIRMGNMIQQIVARCNECNGKGSKMTESNKCNDCNGKGCQQKDKSVSIPLKSGLTHGNKINLSGKGHNLKTGKTDLIIVINELPHKLFKRHNDDLYLSIELKLYQALFGFDKVINHLDGRKLHLNVQTKTDYGMVRRIENEGIKSLQNVKGQLYIKFYFTLPTLNNDNISLIKSTLQNVDKLEVHSEKQILSTPNLQIIKSYDCNTSHSDRIKQLFENIKYEKISVNENENDNENYPQQQQQQQQQCVHQ
jgi:DnaJ-class molecular chaperone